MKQNQVSKTEILKLAKLLQQENKLRKQIQSLREKRGEMKWGCTTSYADGSVGIELSLPDYLALFPDAKPEFCTYFSTSNNCTMGYMKYPLQHLGQGIGETNVWAEAHTKTVPIPSLDKPVAVVSPEVADAFGLNGMPCVQIANGGAL